MTDGRKHNERNFPDGKPKGNPDWKPGVSANPGGKTKAQVAARRMAAEQIHELTQGGATIIAFAVRVLDGEEDDCKDAKSRRWAAEFLAERLWGRATLTVDVTQHNPEQSALLNALMLSPHERRERIAELKARAQPAIPAESTVVTSDDDDR